MSTLKNVLYEEEEFIFLKGNGYPEGFRTVEAHRLLILFYLWNDFR